MNSSNQEASFQKLYDVAVKLLESADKNERAAADAIKKLSATSSRLELRNEEMKRELAASVASMADKTANGAAILLTEKFRAADGAATRAQSRYENAGKKLTLKIVGGTALLQIVLIISGWLLINRSQPSETEIDHRRQTIEALSKQDADLRRGISNLQQEASGMTRKVKDLERRGGRIKVTECNTSSGISVQCVRTDESEQVDSFGSANETYRLLWRKE